MKRQIRNGVFETNSSSTHSISIGNYGEDDSVYEMFSDYYDNKIHITLGEFGWEYNVYCDFYHKLQYALTMVAMTELKGDKNYIDGMEVYRNTKGFKDIEELVKERCHCDGIIIEEDFQIREYKYKDETTYYYNHEGYIDHQSYEDYNSLQNFLDYYGVTLENFLFNTDVKVITDNDNH